MRAHILKNMRSLKMKINTLEFALRAYGAELKNTTHTNVRRRHMR